MHVVQMDILSNSGAASASESGIGQPERSAEPPGFGHAAMIMLLVYLAIMNVRNR